MESAIDDKGRVEDRNYRVTGRILGELIVESGIDRLKRWGEGEYAESDGGSISPRTTQARSNMASARLTFDFEDPEIGGVEEEEEEEEEKEEGEASRKRPRDELRRADEGPRKRLKTLLLPLFSGEGDDDEPATMAAEGVTINVRLDSEKVPEFWASFSIPFVDIVRGICQTLDDDDDDDDDDLEEEKKDEKESEETE